QEGVSSFAFYSLARGCSRYCAGHQSVPAIRSAARTRAGAATSGVCPVARRCQLVRVLLPCPCLLSLLRWPPEFTCHPKCKQELELGRPLAVYAQLQEGVSSFAFY